MSDFAELLHARLVGYAPLAAIVGNRVYPVIKPQDAPVPAVTFLCIYEPRYQTFGEQLDVTKGLWQVSAWGKTYRQTREIRGHCLDALKRYKSPASSPIWHDTFIINAALELYEEDTEQHHCVMEIEAVYG